MPGLPLEGIRVVDVTNSLAGPYCAEILAALGADVVKIEHPERGDDTRTWGPPFWNGEGTLFLAANAGKRSLGLDFRAEAGLEVLLRLADGADVFLQSLRPGLAARIGLGADDLRARNSALVYTTIGAYGRVGPLREEPGYDPVMQAASGIVSITGEPDRPGVRVGTSLIDQGTGLWAAFGTLAALYSRGQTGEGSVVDVSLYETALGLIPYQLIGYLAAGFVQGRSGTAFPLLAPYQVFPTADRGLMIACGADRLFASLCEAIGAPGLAADPRFATNPDRVANRDALVELISERLAREPAETWLERLRAAGVPAAPVRTIDEVAGHEQTEALGLLQPLPHPLIPDYVGVALPLSLDEERLTHRRPPPLHGEHSSEVLTEAGYSEQEIASLAEAGIVRLGSA